MKYRDRNEITRRILNILQDEPKTKTRIMYSAYLSYPQLKEYLQYCIDKNLIELNGDTSYHITQKGRSLLDLQDRIKDLLN